MDERHESNRLEDLPKVLMQTDDEDRLHLKNLSNHLASSEDDALKLLFIGDTNRVVSETPKHDASTRSHCIFTLVISSRQPGSDAVRKSKLNLVDLAGSERVSKMG